MKTLIATGAVLAGFAMLPLCAHADADTDRTHLLSYVQDSAITVKVKAKLADEKMRSLAHISVDTDAKGAVSLSGTARTQQDVDKAIAIARDTDGVTSVSSTIRVKADD